MLRTPAALATPLFRFHAATPASTSAIDEDEQADVGDDVPDAEPRGVVLQLVEALRVEPLGADAHHDVRRQPDDQQRPEGEPAHELGLRHPIGRKCRHGRGSDCPEEHGGAGHVQEEREVPAVGSHAPGFQIMSITIRRTTTSVAVWNQNARDAPNVCASSGLDVVPWAVSSAARCPPAA